MAYCSLLIILPLAIPLRTPQPGLRSHIQTRMHALASDDAVRDVVSAWAAEAALVVILREWAVAVRGARAVVAIGHFGKLDEG